MQSHRRTARGSASSGSLTRRFWGAALALLCGVVAFGIYGQVSQNHALDSQITQLQQKNAQLQQQISDRQREVVEAQTEAWLEEQARKLGYVLPGERVFVLTSPGGGAPPSGGVTAPLPSLSPSPTPTPTPTARPSPSSSGPRAGPLGSPSPSPSPSP